MKLLFRYFGYQLKNCVWVLGRSVLGTLFLMAAVAAVLALVSTVWSKPLISAAEVGVVIPPGQDQTRLAVRLVATGKSVSGISHFQYMDEEAEALAQLDAGALDVVVSLPQNFYENVDMGINTPAKIYVGKDANLQTKVFLELLKDGVQLLQTSEAAVYAILDVSRTYPSVKDAAGLGDLVAKVYVNEALGRSEIYDQQIYGPFGEMDLHQYCFLSALLLLLVILGINFSALFRRDGRPLEERLVMHGVGVLPQLLVRLTILTGILWAVEGIAFLGTYAVTEHFGRGFLYLNGSAAAGMLVGAIVVAAYMQLVYLLAGGDGNGCIVYLAVSILLVLCAGMIVPMAYLPVWAAQIGSCSPFRLLMQYYGRVFFADPSAADSVRMLVLAAVEILAGVMVAWKRWFGGRGFS